ncbi:MAG: cytochrome c [Candidatus Latescibacteria bacterium]|nr:cytochrome c [Candidatus Latescibacterota bacterium]
MKSIIAGALLILIGLLVLERILGQDPEERSYIYYDDMYESVAYKSQTPNPHLPGGITQLTPPEGTIPRGFTPIHYGIAEEEVSRAGAELMSPLTEATIDPARGQEVYGIYCQPCHGAAGLGDGPVVSRGYPPPTSLHTDQAAARADGEIYHILTYGFKNMPAYAVQVLPEDRWQVIAYIRQMQATAQQQAQEAQDDTLNTTL